MTNPLIEQIVEQHEKQFGTQLVAMGDYYSHKEFLLYALKDLSDAKDKECAEKVAIARGEKGETANLNYERGYKKGLKDSAEIANKFTSQPVLGLSDDPTGWARYDCSRGVAKYIRAQLTPNP